MIFNSHFPNVQIVKQTNPTVGTTSSVILPLNNARRGLIVYNSGSTPLYLNFGSTADPNLGVVYQIASGGTYYMTPPYFVGPISAIRTTGSGVAVVTEHTD